MDARILNFFFVGQKTNFRVRVGSKELNIKFVNRRFPYQVLSRSKMVGLKSSFRSLGQTKKKNENAFAGTVRYFCKIWPEGSRVK